MKPIDDSEHPKIKSHLNAPKLRVDTWNALAVLANKIHCSSNPDKDAIFKQFEHDVKHCLNILESIENYHAYPGSALCRKIGNLFHRQEFSKFHEVIAFIIQSLHSNLINYKALLKTLLADEINCHEFIRITEAKTNFYFEVLIVDDLAETRKEILKNEFESYLVPDERFVYELVFVNSYEDALIAIMFNFNIKSCLISDFFTFNSDSENPVFKNLIHKANIVSKANQSQRSINHAVDLAAAIRTLRQNEVDIYYLASHDPEKNSAMHSNKFNKIFYDFEDYFELHLTLLQGIKNHYETPFFDSLKKYTFEPKSTFHALPVARGKSIFNSKWIHDMEEFYGKNIFLAESSATSGGLDSLMNPIGSIRRAMQKASDYFGSHETFFVTNGTSASNKIVLQAILKPGDLVLIEHSCHESHDYGIILTGAFPIYLNGYHVDHCDISGPVTLRTIKEQLLLLKKEKKLSQVKLLILTNCTFDGLVYHVQNFMEEVLAIKPDMIFLWDEAWFAYARCVPHYRLRTAMFSAAYLENRYKESSYQEEYKQFKERLKQHGNSEEFLLQTHLLPDPDKVKIRVYSTQSTHKSLSCLRQGSMIHVYDQEFEKNKENFTHAFVTFSTTSPNYQIIATLDLARRQAELEGFELVQNAIELSMIFRTQINQHELINRYFQALGPADLIPEEFRHSHVKSGYDASRDWATVEKAWMIDDYVIDPTRVTLQLKNGLSGYMMRQTLMDRFGIQVNKVSLNSILLQFNIGTLRSSVSYLLDCLFKIASEFESIPAAKNRVLKTKLPLTPDFTEFSSDYLVYPNLTAGNLRQAFYDGHDDQAVEFVKINNLIKLVRAGKRPVYASILIPVPPGFPALLPGQVITESILEFLMAIDPGCILCGYDLKNGFKIFKEFK